MKIIHENDFELVRHAYCIAGVYYGSPQGQKDGRRRNRRALVAPGTDCGAPQSHCEASGFDTEHLLHHVNHTSQKRKNLSGSDTLWRFPCGVGDPMDPFGVRSG